MLAVSMHLPDLYRRRVAEHRVPDSLNSLFYEVANLLERLHTEPAPPQELTEDAARLKAHLAELTQAVGAELAPAASREATLSALTGGMFAGALDGALLYLHKQTAAQPDVIPSEPLEKSWGVLWNNLARVLEVGQSSWAEAHVDDLHLLSNFGKHENRNSLDEGEEMEQQTREDRGGFQTFLLASFKGGYAMGVVDAAVMFVGGERPEPPAD